MIRTRLLFLSRSALFASVLLGGTAHAAPPWVDRALTLPAGDWAFDLGLGVGHVPPTPGQTEVGAGTNLEMRVGVTDRVELGVRTGVRFGDEFARGIDADQYGRLFDRQTVDGADHVLANPEVRVRGALVRGDVAELGLEGRLFVPIENNEAAIEFGMPVAFHFGRRVRLDTGVYVPVFFPPPNQSASANLSAPLDVWIQVSPKVWLGPMTGLVFEGFNSAPRPLVAPATDLSLGFGVGVAITHYLDFKAQMLFPEVNRESRVFGLGAGVEIRIE